MACALGLRVRGVIVRDSRKVRCFIRVLAHLVQGPNQLDNLVLLDTSVYCFSLLHPLLDNGNLGFDFLNYSGIYFSVNQHLASQIAEVPFQQLGIARGAHAMKSGI